MPKKIGPFAYEKFNGIMVDKLIPLLQFQANPSSNINESDPQSNSSKQFTEIVANSDSIRNVNENWKESSKNANTLLQNERNNIENGKQKRSSCNANT